MRSRPVHAYQVDAGPQLVAALAAALDGSGPAVLPLAPDLPGPRLRAVLDQLRPAALVTEVGTSRLPRDAGGGDAGGGGVREDTAVVIATSGSTGAPKGVELSAAALTHSAASTLSRLGARPGERWLASLPPEHVAGAQVLVRAIVSGNEPIYPTGGARGFDPRAVTASGADYVSLVPTMLGRMLAAGVDLGAFRAVLLGGAVVPPALLRDAAAAGANVVTTYGMTETCGGCVYDGHPLSRVEVEIRDDGRVCVAGPTLFSRYRLDPDRSAAVMDGRWLVTGDLGRWEPGGLRVLGRADDVIVTGGLNVVPDEVAGLLTEHPAIGDAAVVGRPDREWGERVVAVIVPTESHSPPDLPEVRAHVRDRAPAHLAPHELHVRPALPLLESGKHDREALRRALRR